MLHKIVHHVRRHKQHIAAGTLIATSLLVIFFYINSGCGNPTGSGLPQFTIGPSGGTLTSGDIQITIPVSALNGSLVFYLNQLTGSVTGETSIVTGSAYSIGSGSLPHVIFSEPIIVKINYDLTTPATIAATYKLGMLQDDTWFALGNSHFNTQEGYISGEVYSLSAWAIMHVFPDDVGTIEITTTATTLAVGQSYKLQAKVYDYAGVYQSAWGSHCDWYSTVPGVASIERSGDNPNAGLVTANTQGVATAFAYFLGRSNPCTVTVPVPVPPTVTNVSPTSGANTGTTTITITGTNFTGMTAVDLGATNIPQATFVNTTTIVATVQAGLPTQTSDIRVTTGVGQSPINAPADHFTVTGWNSTVIDSTNNVGRYSSLAMDSLSTPWKPRISYYDVTNGDLKYAAWNGSSWDLSTIDSTNNVGQYTSIAINSSGNPSISYFNVSGNALKYASSESSNWYKTTVDSTLLISGQYTSLALDSNGKPKISYHQNNFSDGFNYLIYASFESTWSKTQADNTGNVGAYTSLALYNNKPRISYYDIDNSALKYASSEGGATWYRSTVDNAADVGQYTSIALDASGNPRISYYDATNGDLKYASWNGSSWDITTVDSTDNVGLYTSLVLDGSGYPRISYYDLTNGDLKYASWNGSSWDISIVDSIGDVGQYTSIKLDSYGKPRISYYDATNGDLKYSTF